MCQSKTQCQVQLITAHGDKWTLTINAGANLLELCRQHQIPVEAACNGRGICGKCRVRIVQGNVPASEEDHSVFSEQELTDGYRLACRVRIMDDLTVQLCSLGNALEIQMPGYDAGSAFFKEQHSSAQAEHSVHEAVDTASEEHSAHEAVDTALAEHSVHEAVDTALEEYSAHGAVNAVTADHPVRPAVDAVSAYQTETPVYQIAVDLGSTTLAAVLISRSGDILAQVSAVNSQRAYGADVISRMQASNEGRKDELRACICRDLEQMFLSLMQKQGGSGSVSRIAIAGNTVMLHLLRGYSCEKLGQAPFEPVSLRTECLPYREMFSDVHGCEGAAVYLLPGMSAFAGADITAGLYSSGFWQMPEDETAFFVDLGTNGELACGSRRGFVTAAAAAGPAFEGGRLSCGIPGIPGAVSKVSYLYHRVRIQTIGQKKPCGICGTGALEAVAALLKEGLLNADGLLAPELFEHGMVLSSREDGSKICLTQADIREIQMAKAAIRAGIEVLLMQYRQKFGNNLRTHISRVYLAGGFGYYLSAETAAAVGLFPSEWKDKVVLCGNTSLKGAVSFLTDPACAGELEKICRKNMSIQLEDHPQFQEIYIQQMGFECI